MDEKEFCEVVEYMNYHYDRTRKKKNESGQHSSWEDFTNGKGWLVFYNDKLAELGDKDLNNAAYAELPAEVFVSSDTPSTLTQRLSPTNDSNRSGKERSEARVAANDAIRDKNLQQSLFEREK